VLSASRISGVAAADDDDGGGFGQDEGGYSGVGRNATFNPNQATWAEVPACSALPSWDVMRPSYYVDPLDRATNITAGVESAVSPGTRGELSNVVSVDQPNAASPEPSLETPEQEMLSMINYALRPLGVEVYAEVSVGRIGEFGMLQVNDKDLSGTLLVPVLPDAGMFASYSKTTASRASGSAGIYLGPTGVITDFGRPQPNVGGFIVTGPVEVTIGVSGAELYETMTGPIVQSLQNFEAGVYEYTQFQQAQF
jgi:hypothetical protein